MMTWVPVVGQDGKPLMPITPKRANKLVKDRRATPFWKKGIWCVRLNFMPTQNNIQRIVVGIDTGSHREAMTVKSSSHTYLNLHIHAVTHVKKSIESRRILRRSRRNRNCPYRKCRPNRAALRNKNRLPPSTRARWNLKLRILDWLSLIFPITDVIIEDIKAESKEGEKNKRWNRSFSPLQQGKDYFYSSIKTKWNLHTREGFETAELREKAELPKLPKGKKLEENFFAHCVDSWVLANSVVGGHIKPDNVDFWVLEPRQFNRRNLHVANETIGRKRKDAGGMIRFKGNGIKNNMLVEHPKHGICRIQGGRKTTKKYRLVEGNVAHNPKVFTEAAKIQDFTIITHSSWTVNKPRSKP